MRKKRRKINKIKAYFDHVIANQKLNGMEINPYGNTRFLKFVIGKGNNSILSRIALKTRWWWSEVKRTNFDFNFIWTQWKSRKIITHLPKANDAAKEMKLSDLKDDITKYNSDTDDITSTNQSTNETNTTPSSRKMSRINSDSLTCKHDTPDSQSRSGKKSYN